MALQLHPAELGRVEIRIEQGNNTQATVHVTAERPETLELLMRDQPQLQHVLDQAGIAPDGRNLTFHLASQMQETPRPSTSGSATGFTATAGNPGQSGGTADAGSGGAGFQGSGSRGNGSQHRASSRAAVSRASLRWMRAGINITA